MTFAPDARAPKRCGHKFCIHSPFSEVGSKHQSARNDGACLGSHRPHGPVARIDRIGRLCPSFSSINPGTCSRVKDFFQDRPRQLFGTILEKIHRSGYRATASGGHGTEYGSKFPTLTGPKKLRPGWMTESLRDQTTSRSSTKMAETPVMAVGPALTKQCRKR